jgi:serine/threonine protein kinase
LHVADENESTNHPISFRSEFLSNIPYSKFVLGRMIGSGGFGKVYKAALQNEQHQTVAVKFLRKAFWKDQLAKEMLLHEVDQASKIQHPSIIPYLGWGESPQGAPYLVMHWIEGKTLENCRNISSEKFIETLRNICETVKFIHDHNVIHGDLSPSNILIGDSGQHWITDFGFSKTVPLQNKTTVAHAEPLGGTLGFAAPEQISNAWGSVNAATDIYAIGGLAQWYLTGQAPIAMSSTASSILQTLEAGKEVKFAHKQTEATSLIEDVARLALVKNQSERPASIQPLVNILTRKQS